VSFYLTAAQYAAQDPIEVGYVGRFSAQIGDENVGHVVRGVVASWVPDPFGRSDQLLAEVTFDHLRIGTWLPACLLRKEIR